MLAEKYICLPIDPGRLDLKRPPFLCEDVVGRQLAAAQLEEHLTGVKIPRGEGDWELTEMTDGVRYMEQVTRELYWSYL